MQSSDASRDPEGLFSTYAHPQTSRRLNGFDPAHTQQYDGQLSMADLPVPTQVLGRGSEGCVDFGSSSSSLWRRQDSPQPASSSVSYSKGSNSSSPAWGGSLWSDSGNIWSTGHQVPPVPIRKSVDLPLRSEEGAFSRPHIVNDSRRSLDSLSHLQAIWQAQQKQQGVPDVAQLTSTFSQSQPYSDQHSSLLSQQLNGLAVQDSAAPVPSFISQAQQLRPPNGLHNGQLDDLLYNGGVGLQHGNPNGGKRRPSQLPIMEDDYHQNSQNSGGYQNGQGFGPGVSVGLGNGLAAAQLQAALQDPGAATLLRQHLDANTLLGSAFHTRPQSLEEKLLLARQASNGQTSVQSPQTGLQSAIRQPPPPPPRSMRPQLPPPMQTHPSPPPRPNGTANSKKTSGFTPQRTSAKDRASLLGSRPKANMEVLNKALEELVESLHPSEEETQKQNKSFLKISQLLKARWPHAKVHQFGSTANCLSICNNNDIDVCLEIVEPEGDLNFKSQLIEEMGDLLMDAGMINVLPLPKARVPVVKFVVPESGTKVDVSVNNTLAIVNTKLLRDYAAVDSRLLKLVFIVKHWAKRRQVNDSYRGTLSSYCYVLMCIHHLQTRQPPVLPCLQAIQPPTHIRTIGRWSCDYYDKPLEDFGKDNQETLADLVWKFFENWAWRHDYNNAVVSVRTGTLLTKAQKDWTRRIGNERHLICIEDPFETSHDLGRTVDRQTSGVLHKEFERAAAVLRDQQEPLAQLFEPYRAGKPE